MIANDEMEAIDFHASADCGAGHDAELSTTQPLDESDDSWMDVHTLKLVPPKKMDTVRVTLTDRGRGKPLHHPGIWDDE